MNMRVFVVFCRGQSSTLKLSKEEKAGEVNSQPIPRHRSHSRGSKGREYCSRVRPKRWIFLAQTKDNKSRCRFLNSRKSKSTQTSGPPSKLCMRIKTHTCLCWEKAIASIHFTLCIVAWIVAQAVADPFISFPEKKQQCAQWKICGANIVAGTCSESSTNS